MTQNGELLHLIWVQPDKAVDCCDLIRDEGWDC